MSTEVPVHHYTCSFYLFLFGITATITFQLICWGTYTQIYPKIKLPVYLYASLLSNHKYLPVTTTTCVHVHRSPKMNVPVNFDASEYNHEDLPADSTVYMSIDAPIQKLSPFSVMHPFRFTFAIYPSTHLLLYIYTDLPGNKSTSLS